MKEAMVIINILAGLMAALYLYAKGETPIEQSLMWCFLWGTIGWVI